MSRNTPSQIWSIHKRNGSLDSTVEYVVVVTACNLGKLSPSIIHCGTGARKSREEYLTDVDYVHNGGHGFSIGVSQDGNEDEERRALLENGRDCGSPTRMEDALVYRYVNYRSILLAA